MCIFVENNIKFSHRLGGVETKHKSHSSVSRSYNKFIFERKMSSFPIVDNEVDFIQFNIHSN